MNQDYKASAGDHPITPPDKQLVKKWIEDWAGGQMKGPVNEDQLVVATQAAQWGAEMELEACCEWLDRRLFGRDEIAELRAARRPKPPSLKEQAFQALCRFQAAEGHENCTEEEIVDDFNIIRRALEALDD